MSNETIAVRLLEVVRGALDGTLPVSAFANAVDAHAPAFEGLSHAWLDRLDALSVKAIEEDVSPVEAEVLSFQHSTESLKEAESMLNALCDPAQQPAAGDVRNRRA